MYGGFIKLKYKKIHSYSILEYISHFAFLFIIPLIQQLIFFPHSKAEFLGTLGLNIIICIMIIAWCIIETSNFKYLKTPNTLYIKTGIILKKQSQIKFDKIHSFRISKNIGLMIFNALKITIGIPSNSRKKLNLQLIISNKSLLNDFKKDINDKSIKTYKSNIWKIMLMSALWSNSTTGLLIMSLFINKVGKILGQEALDRLYSTVDIRLKIIAFGVPPLTATIAYILILGWLVAFIVQLFKCSRLTLINDIETIKIKKGLINIDYQIIEKKYINAIFIKQTLLMKLFRLYSANVSAADINKKKKEKSIIIDASNIDTIKKQISQIITTPKIKYIINASKKTLKNFLYMPIIFSSISLIIIYILTYIRLFKPFINLIIVFILPILAWWIIFRVLAFKNTKLIICDNCIISCGYKGLSLINTIIPLEKIQNIEIKQNPFQHLSNRCSFHVFFFSQSKERTIIKHLDIEKVENSVETIESYM